MIQSVIALVFLGFFILYLLFKTLYFQRKYGVNPMAVLQGNMQEKLLWITLFLVFSGYFFVASMGYSESAWSLGAVVVGFMIIILGFAFMVVSQFQMGKNWRMGLDSQGRIELVDTGVFALSRNPIYLGLLSQAFGFTLVFLSLYAVLLLIVLFLVLFLIVLQEEKFLFRIFGKRYYMYTRRVGRFW